MLAFLVLMLLPLLSQSKHLRRRELRTQQQQIYLRQYTDLCVSYQNEDMILARCNSNSPRQLWTFIDGNHWWSKVDGLRAAVGNLRAGTPLKLMSASSENGDYHSWHFNMPNDNTVQNDITPLRTASLCVGHNGGNTARAGDRLVLKDCATSPIAEVQWGFRLASDVQRLPAQQVKSQQSPSRYANIGPTNLVSTATLPPNAVVNLSWSDNAVSEDGYEIKRRRGTTDKWDKIATVARDVRVYTDTSVRDGRSYQYKVRALHGNSYSPYSNIGTVVVSNYSDISPNPEPPIGKSFIDVSYMDVKDVRASHATGLITITVYTAGPDGQYRYCYRVSPQLVSPLWNDIRHSSYLRIYGGDYRSDLNCHEMSHLEIFA